MLPITLFALGAVFVLAGLFVMVPVVVNLPDAWIGGILAVGLLGIGVAFLRAGVKESRARAVVKTMVQK
jgi:membrane protease YdiL (CAAX protease family)